MAKSIIGKGERNTNAKLLDIEVEELRELYHEADVSIGLLAEMFNISESQVYRIVSNKSRVVGKNKPAEKLGWYCSEDIVHRMDEEGHYRR